MRFALAFTLIGLSAVTAHGEVPELDTFRIVPQYPAPAAGATSTLGAGDSAKGRLVFWDGDTVYYQESIDGKLTGVLTPSGTGYAGDPSFVFFKSNDKGVLLGSGDGTLYSMKDVSKGLDFVPGDEIAIPTHFSGALMSNTHLLLDRVRDDSVGAEITMVDISVSPPVAATVLQLPAGSQPAAIAVSGTSRVYVMNATTRELRSFNQTDITDAFEAGTMLDWATDGTPVGAIGQFLNGGVYGVTKDNELVIGGDEGSAGTGGIQWVDPATIPASILDTLDPAGTAPPYVLIYVRDLDRVIAIDPTTTPPTAWAATDAVPVIPPDSPCADFEAINDEFTAFVAQYSPAATDLDGDTIPDTAMLGLIQLYSCDANEDSALTFSTNTAYDDNRETFATEANATPLAAYSRIIPILLFMNDAMQSAVLGLLNGAATPLSGLYTTVTCTDTANCLPEFVEDPVARGVPAPYEPYFGTGDADGDAVTNAVEYANVVDMGGDDHDFVIAAGSDELDGTGDIDTGSGGGGGGGGCFIATAAYGTPMALQLDGLRAFRDTTLLGSPVGAAFVDTYYRLSPPAAAWIAARPEMRAAARVVLFPLVNRNAGIATALATLAGLALLAGAMRRSTGAVQRK